MGITQLVKNFDKHSWAIWDREQSSAGTWYDKRFHLRLECHAEHIDVSSGIDREGRYRMAQMVPVVHETKNYQKM